MSKIIVGNNVYRKTSLEIKFAPIIIKIIFWGIFILYRKNAKNNSVSTKVPKTYLILARFSLNERSPGERPALNVVPKYINHVITIKRDRKITLVSVLCFLTDLMVK